MIARPSCLVTALCLSAMVTIGPFFSAEAQAPERSQRWDPGFEPPRTAWGHPNLQGNWIHATKSAFQRPAGVGPTYTWEEAENIEAGAERNRFRDFAPSDPDRPLLEQTTNPGRFGKGYNSVYQEPNVPLAIVNGEPRTSLITFPSNGRIPELSPEGLRRMEEYREFRSQFGPHDHPELLTLSERCIVRILGPPIIPSGSYNNNVTIVQNADHVMIYAERMHDIRIIRLGEPDPLPAYIRPWFGESWGRWEGNTLVVETTNIHPDTEIPPIGGGSGTPADMIVPSEDMKVIERFTRVDEDTILYEFEVHDPRTYSEPWGGQNAWESFDKQLYSYDCQEHNYGMEGMLSGARYEERMEAENGGR